MYIGDFKFVSAVQASYASLQANPSYCSLWIIAWVSLETLMAVMILSHGYKFFATFPLFPLSVRWA